MHSLVNSNFSRTYNPNGRQNVLCDIKRLLTSRDTESQSKACGYLIEAISKYNCSSIERTRLIEYLLDNDITVFLCEATSNLDSSLFRSILQCIRLLWRVRRFFEEEHASNALSAIIRSLVHYTAVDAFNAVDGCLHFICDLLNGIKEHGTTSALSHQSPYNAEQLLAYLKSLFSHINNKSNTILCSAFVIHALISYQPPSLDLNGNIASLLGDVLDKWFELLMGGLNRIILVGENGDMGSMLLVTCQLGMDTIRLINALQKAKVPPDFVNKILIDEQELTTLKDAALKIKISIQGVIKELVNFNKDNQSMISTEEYGIFLKFLLSFMYENAKTDVLSDFCDFLFSKGYLKMLPETQITRDDPTIRKVSTLVLGEMLKALTTKYLYVQDSECNAICTKDIEMDLVDLQYGIENKENIGILMQKNQPYSLLIYIYFYCQSSENPEESTSPLLPFLVEYLLRIPKNLKLPGHITKALWLVFAMSTVSNGSQQSLEQRVYIEKATDRLVTLLNPEPSLYYTHNPAILFWTFTSLRIPNILRLQVENIVRKPACLREPSKLSKDVKSANTHFISVMDYGLFPLILNLYGTLKRTEYQTNFNISLKQLSEWFKNENNLPSNLTTEPLIWELLLNIIIQSKDSTIITNCMDALNMCMRDADENAKDEFANLIWSLLPSILSNALIDRDNNLAETNITYILDLAIKQLPSDLVQTTCIKIAILITTLYSKNMPDSNMECRNHFEYVCLKLCLLLLDVSREHKDNKVLLTYTNRVGFLPTVLVATNSSDDRVACIALQLLSCIVYYFAKNKFQPKSIIEVKTDLIVKSLRHDSDNERGSHLLQLVYMVLNSSINTPLVLTFNTDLDVNQQWNVLRALMFRIQMMLCCRETTNQSPAGWKTLSSIFKHAIAYKNDPNLVATLTSQPWTHVLIQFQLTLKITPEFLTFTQNWLTFLKITIKKAREISKIHISKHSRIIKTLVILKKGLVSEEFQDANKNIISIVNDIMEECNSEE